VCAPLPICPRLRPLPDGIAAPVRPIRSRRSTCSVPVVSRHYNGLLRSQASGFLHPETGWGSLRFLEYATIQSPAKADNPWMTILLPRTAVHTLRRIPLADSRSASLRPLPSCRLRQFSTAAGHKCPLTDHSPFRQTTNNSLTPAAEAAVARLLLPSDSLTPTNLSRCRSNWARFTFARCLLPRRGLDGATHSAEAQV